MSIHAFEISIDFSQSLANLRHLFSQAKVRSRNYSQLAAVRTLLPLVNYVYGCYDKFRSQVFFDYGAGGCLWAGDDTTREQLGYGPVDATYFDLEGRVSRAPVVSLSDAAHAMIEELDFQHSGYLNPKYPPDPSLWVQTLCERFNTGIDQLLLLLQEELGADYKILDQQNRYTEDPALAEYLAANPELSAIKIVSNPSVH